MSYMALRFDAAAAEADAWSDALLAAGALSVDISDPRAGTPDESPLYAEPGEPALVLWPIARLTALFDGEHDAGAALREAALRVDCPLPPHESTPVPEQDWVRATHAQFGPIRVADDLWIVPTWCVVPDPAALNLRLDPGVAFGTGTHPTTRLCLEWLRANVGDGVAVLDYGSGSGILAIAAAKLGAGRVVGTDIDTQALAASAANAHANAAAVSFVTPDALRSERFDIIVANILTRPLVLLAPLLALHVREGGRIALAGILETQAPIVADAYARWFMIAPWRAVDGWSLLAGVRNDRAGGDESS